MDRGVKATLILILFLISASLPAVSLQAQTSDYGQTNKVVFLEHYMSANGTVLKGKAPFRSVNFPAYWYNENTKQLHGKVDFPVNHSLKMVFGDVITLKGNFGAGTGNKLFGAYAYPVWADQAYIYDVDVFGNIVMKLNNRAVVLKPGESYSYTQNETYKEKNATVQVVYNHTYLNHGFIDKRNISSLNS